MPNIMVFGVSLEDFNTSVKPLIDGALQNIGLGGDAVATWQESRVFSCDGHNREMPYVRVCSTGGSEEIDRIVQALNQSDLCMDCEKFPLPPDGFIPADQMKIN